MIRPVATATAMAFFALASYGQNMTISGTVMGEDGKPLQNAQIRIDRTDMKGTYPVKTNKKGEYLYAGLPFTGTYTVVLVVEGKDVDRIPNQRSRGGAPVENVNFNLAKIKTGDTQQAKQVEQGMTAKEKEEYEKVKKEQEAAMAKNAELNAAFNAGKDAVNAKQWDTAISAFEKASTLDANQHVVWGNLADTYLTRNSAGDIDKAIAAYAKAVGLKPDDPAYHNNYALALAKNKKFEDAQSELAKAAQIDPASAGKYYYNLGAIYVNTGQSKPAGDAFKKAIELDANYADAYYQLGLVMFGDATTAPDGKILPPPGTADQFNKYLALRPDGPNADAAKAMLEAMGSKVETSFQQKKAAPAPKKK